MITERQSCLTGRQEKLLDFLIKEYIETSEPVSSKALKCACDLDVCGATIRNDLQVLTKEGFIHQPHTSSGRVPTEKAYQYFSEKISRAHEQAFHNFVIREIEETRRQLEQEMQAMSEIFSALEMSDAYEEKTIYRALRIIGPTREICADNEIIIKKLLRELNEF